MASTCVYLTEINETIRYCSMNYDIINNNLLFPQEVLGLGKLLTLFASQ